MPDRPIDAVLSSGWLAFASHAGFFAALEDRGAPIAGVCGTSSGALVGALWSAGMPARDILALVTARRPWGWLRAHRRVWRGLFVLDAMVEELARHLPARIEDLDRAFGAGVVDRAGQPRVLTSGPLSPAVAASCAVPGLFASVPVDGQRFADGGVADRLGLDAWQRHRPEAHRLVHLVDRTAGPLANPGGDPTVRSAPSGAQLWSLGDARSRFERTRAATLAVLDDWPLPGA